MPKKLKTPGVYIEEIGDYPMSIAGVETSVPAFIGYTEKATKEGKDLLNKPVRISSFTDYQELFGGAFHAKFDITPIVDLDAKAAITINGNDYRIGFAENNKSLLYPSMEFFYANGGGDCYIVSVGTYQGKSSLTLDMEDLLGTKVVNNIAIEGGLKVLEKEQEPTMLVIPDAVNLTSEQCYTVYKAVLKQCATLQSRVAILDIPNGFQENGSGGADVNIVSFRNAIGTEYLSYGAAYYPWLHTNITQKSEVDLENINLELTDLAELLPEDTAITLINAYLNDIEKNEHKKQDLHIELLAISSTYTHIIEEICGFINLLPPSSAMAGIYTRVDNSSGVWKPPANVSVSNVIKPSVNITHEDQEGLNVDFSGKSINAIRIFPVRGTLVWGARTLDGNSSDWRYINIRRTAIMLKQSIKLALGALVFEPNDANTWHVAKNMISNFLTGIWSQGALAGASPKDSFAVQVGLNITMTSQDILEGRMIVLVMFAPVRPAEFIVLKIVQQMQGS